MFVNPLLALAAASIAIAGCAPVAPPAKTQFEPIKSACAGRDGKRAGSGTTDLMATQAMALTDQQIADLAAYYGSVQGQLKDLKDAY